MMDKRKQLNAIILELKEATLLVIESAESLLAAGANSQKFDSKKGMKKSPRWGFMSATRACRKLDKIINKLETLDQK